LSRVVSGRLKNQVQRIYKQAGQHTHTGDRTENKCEGPTYIANTNEYD